MDMVNKKRKVNFFSLSLSKEGVVYPMAEHMQRLSTYINSLSATDRKLDLRDDKIYLIDTIEFVSPYILNILFKSAKHSYRAPLLDKNTVEERDNPKTITEGERINTHVLLKFEENTVSMFLEAGNNLLKGRYIIDYLNHMIHRYNTYNDIEHQIPGTIDLDMIVSEQFIQALENAQRITCATLYTEKSIIGPDYLNFANQTEEVKDEVTIELHANRRRSLKDMLYHVNDHLNGVNSHIKRIRAKGLLSNGNEITLDTEAMIKKEFIEVQQDRETGIFYTPNVFAQLAVLANRN